MKIRTLFLVTCGCAIVCAHAAEDSSPQDAMRKLLTGTWRLDQRQGERWASQINEYREDGTVTTTVAFQAGEGVQNLKIESRWKMEGSKVTYVTLSSTDVKAHPVGEESSDRILSLNSDDFRYLNGTGNERLEKRTTAKEPGEPDKNLGFKLDSITLYQTNDELDDRAANAESLSAYIRAIQAVCSRFFDCADHPENLNVIVAVRPGMLSKVWLDSSSGSDEGPARAELKKKLEALKSVEVKGGPIAFALICKLGGGIEAPPMTQPPVPAEWKEAATSQGGPVSIPDGVLELVWPQPK